MPPVQKKPLLKFRKVWPVDKVAPVFTKEDFDVIILNEDIPLSPRPDTAGHKVIWIGVDVNYLQALKVLKIGHENMPWLEYVTFQYQDQRWSNQIYLGADNLWISHYGLKKLRYRDFDAIFNLSVDQHSFENIVKTFRE